MMQGEFHLIYFPHLKLLLIPRLRYSSIRNAMYMLSFLSGC